MRCLVSTSGNKHSYLRYYKKDLIDVKTLIQYGILCCGNGGLAAYKLEVEFNQLCHVIAKVSPDTCSRIKAANMIDLFKEKFTEKTDQWKN